MNWLVSLFSGRSKQDNRRGVAMLSTHNAFSLPTSSPRTSHYADAFDPETINTPDQENSAQSFSYPPTNNAYGTVPLHSADPRTSTLLPLHQNNYPTATGANPFAHTFSRLRTWLFREYPELGDTLNYGISPLSFSELELQFGTPVPAAVRDSYLVCDGQEAESSAGCSEGLFYGLTFLPFEDVLEEWRFWREVDEDPNTGANPRLKESMRSLPDGWVRKEYSCRGWLPLITDKVGNYIGVDLAPDHAGSVGQVIVFGRDFDTKVVLWRGNGPDGWASWLSNFVDELESGEGFDIGGQNDSDGDEDDVGYEGYFYDGTGRGEPAGGPEGGSTGGGLRLNGEYRGWNVMEALADRSLRRWHHAGVIQEVTDFEREASRNQINDLGVSHFVNGSGAEVAIPVLAEADAPVPSPTTPQQAAPLISITNIANKPPAPLPLDVPLSEEYLIEKSLPPPPSTSFDVDLEASAESSVTMREVSRPVQQAPLIAAPPRSDRPSSQPKTDLLNEPDPTLGVTPIEPAPASPQKSPVSEATKADEVDGDDATAPSIRLVGAKVDAVATESATSPSIELADVSEPAASIAEVNNEVTPGSKHEKNKKSITSGIKNLVRRKDSSSSISTITGPTAEPS